MRYILSLLLVLILTSACEITYEPNPGGSTSSGGTTGGSTPGGDSGTVTNVVDGDTIDVRIGEVGYRVRYIGVNTPERGEACYSEATDANELLVMGQTVTLVQDVSNTDDFGRLLRYVYVGSTFVNEWLVENGYAEAASYPPDTAFFDYFRELEQEAASAGRGCHPTGIFNDGSDTR